MKLKSGDLKIFYEGELSETLDDEIRMFLRRFGYKPYASGFNFTNNVRDLAFEKKGGKK